MTTTIRRGAESDFDALLGFFDEAVEWMVARGQPDQWGTEPWSTQPKRVARVKQYTTHPGFWMAEHDGHPAGTLVLGGEPPLWIPPAKEPDHYVQLLITSRHHAGHGIGAALLAFAADRTREDNRPLLRVDCWAGAGGKLISYYEAQGFTRSDTFKVGTWPGQVLERRVL